MFDLYVLSLGGHATRALLAAGLSDEERSDARAVVESLEYEAFEGQVVEFLEPEARSQYGTSDSWDEMRLKVLELLDDG